MSLLGDAATLYAGYGWHVFPLHSITDDGCTCGRALDECASPGKHPRTRNGLKDATTRDSAIRAWWTRWPDANVGVRTGAISSIVVIDIDAGKDGFTSLARLEVDHGESLITKEAETGSGGAHLFYQHPDQELGNTASKLGLGIDTRGDGGYVVAPPSRHASGGWYRWFQDGHRRIERLPAWLLDTLTKPDPVPPRGPVHLPDRERGNRYWFAALKSEVETVRGAVQGTRNHTLNRAAFNMGQLITTGAPLDPVTQVLEAAGLNIGLTAVEVRRTVASGLAGGMKAPRTL